MYDFLDKTTYTDDLAQQEDMFNNVLNTMYQKDGSAFETIDPDLIEIADKQEQQDPQTDQNDEQQQDTQEPDTDYDDSGAADMSLLNMLFNEQTPQSSGDYSGINNVVGSNVDLSWLKTKSANVKLGGLNANLSKYINQLPEDIRSNLVATSGNDQDHAEGSAHYDNRAIDLRFNKRAYDFIQNDPVAKSLGISTLPPDHGTAPHIHLQTKKYGGSAKYNFGGKTLFADTEQTLKQGLNDNAYDSAMLKLAGTNTIRGLDNGQPVSVTDGSKYKVLTGANDTAQFKGNVYEKRL